MESASILSSPSGRSLSADQSGMETLTLLDGFGATTNQSSEKPQGSKGEKSKVSKDTTTGEIDYSHALPSGRSLSDDQSGMEALNLVLGFGATTKPSGEKPQGNAGEKSNVSKDTTTGLALPESSILSGHPSSHALPSGRSLSDDQFGMEALNLVLGFGATTKPSVEKPQGNEGEKSNVSKDTTTDPERTCIGGYFVGIGAWTHYMHNRKREATENTANVLPPSFKRMKHGCPHDASLDLKLYLDPWVIKKTLKKSDIGDLYRLLLPKTPVQAHILRLCRNAERIANGIPVAVWDFDTNSEHELIFKYWPSGSGVYVLQGNWTKDFVRRRNLKKGDKIGLYWDGSYSRFNFRVLNRA
ncbi:hypothetical protein FH972_012228 [Carpinus fangiana]|uniref:TF-B3 domain-containing protein n=1 Tax=Carpinus fangiana TaxID=176857 RepID=A0A5N6R6C5_9ROSI|nr:hypothetical protein FH972_012228 [Carpinus fangiana]